MHDFQFIYPFSLEWYRYTWLRNRVDNCNLMERKPDGVEGLEEAYSYMQNVLHYEKNSEKYLKTLNEVYHPRGHGLIGKFCKSSNETGEEYGCPMHYSELAARDPVFYQWHGHLEDLVQQYRESKLPQHQESDFHLNENIIVESVKTDMGWDLYSLENVLGKVLNQKFFSNWQPIHAEFDGKQDNNPFDLRP